ncbi:MAG: hypothetical protein RLZZ584_408 [Pseudomonadota bacterium]
MSRLLWWLLIGLGAWWLLRRVRRGPSVDQPQARPSATSVRAPQAMVRCAHCGLHLPQVDAVTDEAGRSYCSAAHRSVGPA